MRVLHLSADYPDPLVPAKTAAISRLVALVPEHEHSVWSLNRVGWRSGIEALDFDDAGGVGHRAVAYGAPPKGLFLKRFLDRLADWIAEDAAARGFAPDLVHAHKLSVEGLAGLRIAERLGVPLVVSLQGDSDLKIVEAKRDLRALYRRIWREAALVLPFAPWTETRLAALLGPREGPTRLLPCATPAEAILPPRVCGPVFRSAFHLGVAGRKNAHALIEAAGRAARTVPEMRLEILGGGDAAAFAGLSAHARRVAPGRVRFLGSTPNDRVQALFNCSCAFALPSRRESFGMVFVEALLAGAPCLIPRGWGIDGYLPDGEATLAVDPASVDAIAEGLVRLAREEAAFKARLSGLVEQGALDRFRREAVATVYREGLATAVPA